MLLAASMVFLFKYFNMSSFGTSRKKTLPSDCARGLNFGCIGLEPLKEITELLVANFTNCSASASRNLSEPSVIN